MHIFKKANLDGRNVSKNFYDLAEIEFIVRTFNERNLVRNVFHNKKYKLYIIDMIDIDMTLMV